MIGALVVNGILGVGVVVVVDEPPDAGGVVDEVAGGGEVVDGVDVVEGDDVVDGVGRMGDVVVVVVAAFAETATAPTLIAAAAISECFRKFRRCSSD